MTSIELSRSVLAEPSSVALVLAGPAARELWPSSADRPVSAVDGPPPSSVTVDPPRRAGVGFAARMIVRSGATTIAAGRLSIRPAAANTGGSEIALAVTADEAHCRSVRRDAERYLDNLVRVSTDRSSAA